MQTLSSQQLSMVSGGWGNDYYDDDDEPLIKIDEVINHIFETIDTNFNDHWLNVPLKATVVVATVSLGLAILVICEAYRDTEANKI